MRFPRRVVVVCFALVLTGCSSASRPTSQPPTPPFRAATSFPSARPTSSLTPHPSPTSNPGPRFDLLAEWEEGTLHAVAWLPDSTGLALSVGVSDPLDVRLYDMKRLALRWVSTGGYALSLVVSPDSASIARPDPAFGRITFLDVGTGGERGQIVDDYRCYGGEQILFTPDGRALLTGHKGVTDPPVVGVYLWDLPSGSCEGEVFFSDGFLNSMAISPEGNTLAIGFTNLRAAEGEPSQVVLLDIPTRAEQCRIAGEWAAFSPTGETVVVVVPDGNGLAIHSANDCEYQRFIEGPSYPLTLSADGALIASASSVSIAIRDFDTGERLQVIHWSYEDRPAFLEFSPDSRFLMAASKGGGSRRATIAIWQLAGSAP